jgi:signal transduction histidine kinase
VVDGDARDEGAQLGRLFEGGGTLGSAFDQLRQARNQVESILQVVVGDDGVLVQDFTGRIAYANASGARLLGADSVSALLRTPSAQLLATLAIEDEHGADLSGELPGTGILRGGPAAERTLQLRRGEGEPRWVTARTLAQHDDRGAVVTAITILRDITDQRLTADFRESLLGIASHDLRQPLSAIMMASGAMALRADKLEPRMAKLVLQIQNSTERASRMVHDLLDLTQARLGGGIPVAPRPVAVQPLLASVVDEVLAAHPDRRIELECVDAGSAAWDGDRIAQVIANLLGNAMTYGDPEHPVTVRVAAAPEEISITVSNRGPAIPPEQLQRVFEPFMRGTDAGRYQRSVGLGLYIVKEIVASHGGRVTAASCADAGTAFTVELPRG